MWNGQIGVLTALLFVLAFVAALTLGPSGLDITSEVAVVPGLVCGIVACFMAAWGRSQWSASLAILLAIAATALAGPVIGFLFFFGFMTGVGTLVALIGSWVDAGMEDVGWQPIWLLLIAAFMLSFFVSQAWAVMRAWTTWKRA